MWNRIRTIIKTAKSKSKSTSKTKSEKIEFKRRYVLYGAVLKRLYGVKPRKKIENIANDIIDRDIYGLTDNDTWARAIATFNVGYKLSLINMKEAKKYLLSAYEQLSNEDVLSGNSVAFQYLEDTLLNLQEIYIRQNNFNDAYRLNREYMKIIEREKNEIFKPMYFEYVNDDNQMKILDLMIEYRKKYVDGQKIEMKLLSKMGLRFEAEELYRNIIRESGIELTDEAYDLSINENGIENGRYIVISNGITYRKKILGNEKYLFIKNNIENLKGFKLSENFIKKPNEKHSRTDVDQIKKAEAEEKKKELSDFEKRYDDYNILAKVILGIPAKEKLKDVKKDLIHKDLYDMTSSDKITQGIATFRVGHKLATLKTMKKESVLLLKNAISILHNEEILAKNDDIITILENAYMDLGNLYLMNNEFANAEDSFVKYMEIVRKEKIEKFDPKILDAKNNGEIIKEIDLWMQVKAKFTAGKKSMIKLLSKSGRKEEAEQLYKKLLKDCKIYLVDEEYKLSVDTNCIENGRYMRIKNGKTYSEPILGNEYLLLRRKNISDKALENMER